MTSILECSLWIQIECLSKLRGFHDPFKDCRAMQVVTTDGLCIRNLMDLCVWIYTTCHGVMKEYEGFLPFQLSSFNVLRIYWIL